MTRPFKITLGVLAVGVAAGVLYFRGLHEQVLRLAQTQQSDERARREVAQQAVATPSDAKVKARIFYLSEDDPAQLAPVEVELALSADRVQRAKQVILALSGSPPKPTMRTVPPDAVLLEFYLLSDGTAVADFSDTLARATPSGILSEQLAVDSIVRTLQANVASIRRLKILINGQEVDTLAGHADLSGFFVLQPPALLTPVQPKTATELTPPPAPGKL